MKIVKALTLASSVICLMGLPTYIGIKLDHALLGIIIGFILTISYLISIIVKRK